MSPSGGRLHVVLCLVNHSDLIVPFFERKADAWEIYVVVTAEVGANESRETRSLSTEKAILL